MRRPAAFRRPAAAAPPSRHGGAAEWETLGSNPVGEEVGLGHLGRVGEAWLKLKGFWKVWNVQIFDMNFHFESAVEGHELWLDEQYSKLKTLVVLFLHGVSTTQLYRKLYREYYIKKIHYKAPYLPIQSMKGTISHSVE